MRLVRRDALSLMATAVAATVLPSSRVAAAIVDDLYGHRLLFNAAGEPLVPLGMMQGQSRVVVHSSSGLIVDVAGSVVEVGADVSVVVERVSGVAGVVRDLQVIETLEGPDRSQRKARLDLWQKRGLKVRAVDVGGVYGVKGTVVDNRAVLIVADAAIPAGHDDVRPVPVEWLDAPPSAVMRVTAASSSSTGPLVRVRAKNGGSVVVEKVEHSIGYADHGFEDRLLRDEVLVVPDRRGLLAVVNLVDENVMVAGVLPSEMFASAPLEALKAQAVTARGELFAKIGRRHFADPFIVCTEQHCQVYRGQTAEHPRSNDAAKQTAGELAFLDGHVVDSVYSACCGGHSEPAEVVWDKPPRPELVGRPDAPTVVEAKAPWLSPDTASGFFVGAVVAGRLSKAPAIPAALVTDDDVRRFLDVPREASWCGRSSFNQKGTAWRWERRFTQSELTAACADLGVGLVQRLIVEGRGPGGRLRALRIEGSAGTARVLRELPVRKRFGNLRSGLFVVDEERDSSGVLVGVVLRGAGFGHGSGMCQQGAIGMAEAGASYTDILAHAYNGAVVKRVF
jgi:stage II sporulation protein D